MATKTKRTRTEREPAARSAAIAKSSTRFPIWAWCLAGFATLYALFEVYGPAMHAPFVFDDLFLSYTKAIAGTLPLRTWLGVRPVLGISYWTDFQLWGRDTFPYHVMNLLIHFGAGVALFFVFRKLLSFSDTVDPQRTVLAAFGALLFLFHPIQSEVAAYTASRSESLSLMFFLCALCAFLYRRSRAIDWEGTAIVVGLFVLALGSKEHAITLPVLLLLTDYFWNPGFSFAGIRANWRLYVPLATFALIGGVALSLYVFLDPMIGFHIQNLKASSYFFTQCRVIFKYLQLFAFPISQTVDYDFPLSHTPFEHGAIVALFVLILLAAAAFLFRRRYPFAAYGYFAFLLLLSPTSSFIPINDVIVERRLYLPFFALVLILFEPLRRVQAKPLYLAAGLGAVCCIAAYATWERANVWSSPSSLFREAAANSPGKARVHLGYANALYHQGRCREALDEYGKASQLSTIDYVLYFNLAAAYECIHQPDDALRMAEQSIALSPKADAYALESKIYNDKGDFAQGSAFASAALARDNYYTPAFVYRGYANAALGKIPEAESDFRRCLRLDPKNEMAARGLAMLMQQRRQP